MKSVSFFAGVLACILVSQNAAASLIVNGSFEISPLNPGGGWIPMGAGDSSITGWTTTGGGIDYIGTIWVAAEGTRSVDLNNVSPGGVSQTFNTVAGEEYLVSFAMSANMYGGPAEKVLQVSAGNSSAEFLFDYVLEGSTPADPKWKYFQWSFIATGSTSTLQFLSLSGGVYGPAIDDVVVTGVPSPGALAAIALALAAPRRRRD